MRKEQLRFYPLLYIALLVQALALSGCVSIDLKENEVRRAKNVSYRAPKAPFKSVKNKDVDKLWRHSQNGNAISFLSDCENPSDPRLESIESGVLSGLNDLRYLKQDSIMYNQRAARHSLVSGKVDGIPTRLELITFKKNGCIYVLTYVALESSFEQNQENFDQFVKGFEAP